MTRSILGRKPNCGSIRCRIPLLPTQNANLNDRSRTMNLSIRLLVAASMLVGNSLLAASSNESNLEDDGWTGVAQRDEIRPTFLFKKNGGPDNKGSLIIRADDREGLDGHWTKTF